MTALQPALAALRDELLLGQETPVSRIVPYPPSEEYALRDEVGALVEALEAAGWAVARVSLRRLLIDRIRAQGGGFVERVVAMEQRTAAASPERGLAYLAAKLAPLVEGSDGLAADCARAIRAATAGGGARRLALLVELGALYPFLSPSALLRHLEGHTDGVPVVVLYPGARSGVCGLSLLGELDPDDGHRLPLYP